MRYFLKIFILLFILKQLLFAIDFTCANPKEFEPVFSANLFGKLIISGNTSLCENNSGQCGDPGDSRNNNIDMMHDDYDDINGTADFSTTVLNSSAALIDIPAGKKVIWAGLLWQGYMHGNWTDTAKEEGQKIKFKHHDASAYETKSDAEMNWVYFSSNRMYYQSFIEITDYVNNHKGGYYWVGDIATSEGQPIGGSYGAWSIAVVYEDRDVELNNISVYHGYQAFAQSGDVDDALEYAEDNDCDTSNTGVGNTVSSTLSGFLTPKSGTVNSSFVVFAGEGDKGLEGDYGHITDKLGTEYFLTDGLNPQDDIMNATITNNGNTVTSRIPYYSSNSLGADIDTYDTSGILSNEQSSTTITLSTNGDGYMPGLYGLQTQLYKPEFCYDYSYSQYDQYFTEDYNATNGPFITGPVAIDEPVKVKLYLRNEENSDISAQDVYLNVLDINTTQATYQPESVSIVYPGEIYTTDIPDSSFNVDANLSNVENIPAGEIEGKENIYLYYYLEPKKSTLDMPINARVDYNLVIPTSSTESISIPYKITLDKNVPICTDDKEYIPVRGRFNVVEQSFYTADETTNGDTFYNLPTQITKREGSFKILSHDPDNLNELLPLPYATWLAVEIIDASAFHDTTASCEELSSAVNNPVWVALDANQTSLTFDKAAIQQAIDNEQTELISTSEFYQTAVKNAAFRVSYNADSNGSLVKTTKIESGAHAGNYSVDNFTELAQGLEEYNSDLPANEQNKCVRPITVGNKTYKTMPESCGNASSKNGLSPEDLTICMQCVYGANTKFYCSRDNFSIRPESFKINFSDQNQTNPTTKQLIADNENSIGTSITVDTDLTAGYEYNFNLIATSFIDANASTGYTQQFSSGTDANITYLWSPATAVTCNDTDNKSIDILMVNGLLDTNSSIEQVGQYQLSARDSLWTQYDSDPNYMKHHDSDPTYFKPSTTPDCTPNSSATYPLGSASLNGCDISSVHDNNNLNLSYQDIPVRFKPYRFNIDSAANPIVFSRRADNNTTLNNTFIYTSNVDDNNSMNMALNITGSIIPEGFNGSTLSNYTGNCYADDLDLTLNRVMPAIFDEAYQARFMDRNSTGAIITDTTQDVNVTNQLFTVADGNFTLDNNGILPLEMHLNFAREANQPRQPLRVQLDRFNVNCTTAADCQFNADLINNQEANATRNLGGDILTHYYGRVHAPDQSFEGSTGTANIFYEVYCQNCDEPTRTNFLIGNTESPDAINWYQNELHDDVNDGQVYNYVAVGGTVTNTLNTAVFNGEELQDLTSNKVPNKERIQMTPDPWLLYNRFDPTPNTNDFNVEFYAPGGEWAGDGDLGHTVDENVSTIQNRRLDW